MSADPITLIAGADNNYAMPLAVTLSSALRHLSPTRVDVYVLDGGVAEANRQRVERTLRQTGADVHVRWVRPEANLLAGLPSMGHLGQAAYLRLAAPRLVTAAKAIYLDSDLVVQGDLRHLWDMDMKGQPVAAVVNLGDSAMRENISDWRQQRLDPDAPYYNSGVLVLDLDQWRTRDLGERALANLRRHGTTYDFADQDGLNATLQGEWFALDARWNVPVSGLKDRSLLREAHVLHYTGAQKPWLLQSLKPTVCAQAYERFFGELKRSRWFSPDEYARLRLRLGLLAVRSLPFRIKRVAAEAVGTHATG